MTRLENDSDTEDEDLPPVRPPRAQWTRRDPGLIGTNTPAFIKPVMSPENQDKLDSLSSAYDYYKLFMGDGFANEVVFQSRLYAVQKGFGSSLPHISRDNYRYLGKKYLRICKGKNLSLPVWIFFLCLLCCIEN